MMATMPAQKPHRSKQDYETPAEFIVAVKTLLGVKAFSHDYAASATNAQAVTYYDEEINALSMSNHAWVAAAGREWGWLNPPYTNIAPWAARCAQAARAGAKIAFLVPAAVGSVWYSTHVHEIAHVLFVQPRICFIPGAPYPKDVILALYGWEPGYDVWRWK